MSTLNRASADTVRIDAARGVLLRDGRPVKLRAKTWSVLLYLAERPGLLVSRGQLLDALWPGVAVTPETVSKSISELRVALGDDARPARYIETANRRGYRLLVDLLAVPTPATEASPPPSFPCPQSDQRPMHVLVGREEELGILTERLQRAQAGEPQIVMVSGPAGIGKTALVSSFLASSAVCDAASVRFVRAGCFESHGPAEPLQPVLEALQSLARQSPNRGQLVELMRRAAPMWLAQMPWLLEPRDWTALRRGLLGVGAQRMPREFAALLEGLATDHTLVLVLEDLHWSDPATSDVIALLAQRRAPLRLMLVGTYRPADAVVRDHSLARNVRTMLAQRQCVEISLHDLTEDAVRAYLAARFPGNAFPEAMGGYLHAHTGGQPLFLVSAVDYMVAHGWIAAADTGYTLGAPLDSIDLGIPEDARLLLETQLYEHSPEERAVLEAASVADGEITTRTLAAALDLDAADVESCCETLARFASFLQVAGTVEWPDGDIARRYAFTHEFHRRVTYQSIAEERRVRLHRRVGEALEAAHCARAPDIAGLLAAHFRRGRDHVRAQRYLIAAGRRARASFATREAIACFETALATTAVLPSSAAHDRMELEVRLELGRALADGDGFAADSVRVNYDRVSELCATAGSAAELFEAIYARWYLSSLRGQRGETNALAFRLEDLARRLGTPEHCVLAESARVRLALWDGRITEARESMQALLAHEADLREASTATFYGMDPLVSATMHHASVLWLLGETAEAEATVSAGIARARASWNPFYLAGALAQGAMVQLFLRNVDAGADLAEQASRVAAEYEFAFWHAYASALQGWALVQQGEAAAGARTIERAAGALRATGTRLFLSCIHAFLAEAHLRSGAYAEGLAAVRRGLEIAEASFGCGYEPELWRLRGELLLAEDAEDRSRGEAALLRALELARASQARSLELRAAVSLAGTWRRGSRTTEARDVLRGVCDWFASRPESRDLTTARMLLSSSSH